MVKCDKEMKKSSNIPELKQIPALFFGWKTQWICEFLLSTYDVVKGHLL